MPITPSGAQACPSARLRRMAKDDEEVVEVKCPECGATVRVPLAQAERDMKATCPKGHEIPLARAVG